MSNCNSKNIVTGYPQRKESFNTVNDDEGAISVVMHPHPPIDQDTIYPRPYTASFLNSASNDMKVNGSVTNVDFSISASPDFDIYVKVVSVVLSDAGAELNKFGNLSALTNGVQIIHQTIDVGTTLINSGIKTNLEFVRQSLGSPSFGTGTDAFKADLTGGGADAYLPIIDMSKIFGMPYGLRLRKASTDKLYFRIRDNLTGLDQFDAVAYGIQI